MANREWQPKSVQLVVAHGEFEARELCFNTFKSDTVWISDNCDVTEIDLEKDQIIDLEMYGVPYACG